MSPSFNQPSPPVRTDGPFPIKCNSCGRNTVELRTIDYTSYQLYDGVYHSHVVKNLTIPICSVCDTKIFTQDVDEQIRAAWAIHPVRLKAKRMRDQADNVNAVSNAILNES